MDSSKFGKIYLIPNIISNDTESMVITPITLSVIPSLDYYLVEDFRTARRYLSKLFKTLPEDRRKEIQGIQFELITKRTEEIEVNELLKPVLQGRDAGIITESGCPGIADPGALIVKAAHEHKIKVIPIPGPSSIFLALMGSGMNGQSFSFQGYLPIDLSSLKHKIKKLESDSRRLNQTQIFIETPYRNQRIFQNLIKVCDSETRLCICVDLTGSNEMIQSKTIADWEKHPLEFPKLPTVFLIET